MEQVIILSLVLIHIGPASDFALAVRDVGQVGSRG